MRIFLFLSSLFLGYNISFAQDVKTLNIPDDGYRGIWYSNQPSGDQYIYKYSGGLGTYPANHYPFSVYVEKVNKTFFCYGGTDKEGKTLLHMVSYYDHETGTVPRPTIVLDKQTDNAHDNPVINVDDQGYIWLFSTSNGTNRPSFIHRSIRPYDITTFELVQVTKIVDSAPLPLDNFSYLQSWYQKGKGFLNLFTHYDVNVVPNQPDKIRRTISFMRSKDGVSYGTWDDIAFIEEGHYQTSGQADDRIIGTTFNYHPYKVGESGLNYRTNLYYLETRDFGETWQTADGTVVSLPIDAVDHVALVKDYAQKGLNVYINDLTYDQQGYPVILYVTSKGYRSGPISGKRKWYTTRFTGKDWVTQPVTSSDNNYDMGSLYIDQNGVWHIVGPTDKGPQRYNTGGEMVMWTSHNQGKRWRKKALTKKSVYNHSYARRPVNVHPDFYAFWADGHGREKSISRLHFADKEGNVYRLPYDMIEDVAFPELINLR